MVSCTEFPITVRKQRDFLMYVFMRDVNNDPISLTDWAGIAQIREAAPPDSKLILTFAVSAADVALGKIAIYGSKDITQVCQDTGYWDLVLTNPDGVSDSYLTGEVTFSTLPTVVGDTHTTW